MRYRVVSFVPDRYGETIRAVLEDDAPEGNWTDLQCGTGTTMSRILRELFERGGALELIPFYPTSEVAPEVGTAEVKTGG